MVAAANGNSPVKDDAIATKSAGDDEATNDQECTSGSPPSKRIKLDTADERISPPTTAEAPIGEKPVDAMDSTSDRGGSSIVTRSPLASNSSGQSSGHSSGQSTTGSSAESLQLQQPSNLATAPEVPVLSPLKPDAEAKTSAAPEKEVAPLKSTTMHHLRTKYVGELEYMLIEFRKLERQLVGAKGAAKLEESAGSRERREKLHSFILHLEDTVRQVEEGCKLEDEGKSAIVSGISDNGSHSGDDAKRKMAETSALANLTTEKEAEENVQKLEEHILANLLPVKVRLKKQLAAQQGATRNPAGMPATRRGMLQPSTSHGKGTFAAAAEERIKQAEAARLAAQRQQEQRMSHLSNQSQFGRALGGVGSSLTRSLHGKTLGSKERPDGHGVGTPSQTSDDASSPSTKRILYAGMVPQSTQHKSGVAAATGVHDMVIENPCFLPSATPQIEQVPDSTLTVEEPSHLPVNDASMNVTLSTAVSAPHSPPISKPTYSIDKDTENLSSMKVSEEERRKLRKKRRKRKLLRIARRRERDRQRQLALNQQAQANHLKVTGGRKKAVLGKGLGRKKGPRAVEYICANCSEAYNSTCDYNPWWALAQHECPKCRKVQIPRIDITSPANSIEYHPALLAHADDNGASGGGAANIGVMHIPKAATPAIPAYPSISLSKEMAAPVDSDSESDLSELSDYSLSDCSLDSDDSDLNIPSLTPAERAEHETFGHDYKGPVLPDNEAARLLILMSHASTCPCKHKSRRHREICLSTKYMMLHVRDCPGTTSNFDVCPFPWCRKVKHLLYHLVSCQNPRQCAICSPTDISKSLQSLSGLNTFRGKKYATRLRMQAAKRRAALGNGQVAGRPNVAAPVSKPEATASKTKPITSTFQSRVTNEAAHLKALAHATAKPASTTPALPTTYSKPTQPTPPFQAWKPATSQAKPLAHLSTTGPASKLVQIAPVIPSKVQDPLPHPGAPSQHSASLSMAKPPPTTSIQIANPIANPVVDPTQAKTEVTSLPISSESSVAAMAPASASSSTPPPGGHSIQSMASGGKVESNSDMVKVGG